MPLSRLDRRGLLILSGVGAFAVVLLATVVGVTWSRPIIGPDNCVYRDRRLLRRVSTDQTVILVDQSEALTETHRRFALSFIKDYVADETRFAERSRIALFPFSKTTFESREGPRLRPSSDLCRPPSRGNDLYENNRKITKDFYQRFLVPVTATLEESLTTEVGEQSPDPRDAAAHLAVAGDRRRGAQDVDRRLRHAAKHRGLQPLRATPWLR